MDLTKMLAEMRRELEILNAAIASLEPLERRRLPEKGSSVRKATRPPVGNGVRKAESGIAVQNTPHGSEATPPRQGHRRR